MHRDHGGVLVNGTAFDAIPAALARARANATARALARAKWLVRRKRDGRYLAALHSNGRLEPLAVLTGAESHALSRFVTSLAQASAAARRALPIDGLARRLTQLGLDSDAYAQRTHLPLVAEPAVLVFAGRDRYRRPLWLETGTARAWRQMQVAALREGIRLEAISGFRGHDYQLGIFERKRARGQSIEAILEVNAAPGFSEHHSGRALDLSTPGEPAAEESFEGTPAFAWLRTHAVTFGFRMSYPRDNPHGIVYEPWHWYFEG